MSSYQPIYGYKIPLNISAMFLKEKTNVHYFNMFFDGDGIISLTGHARKAVTSE